MQSHIVTLTSLRAKRTAQRLLAGETLALAYGREIVADIVPRKRRSKRVPTMDEILAPVIAAAKTAKPVRDLILEDRGKSNR